MCILLWAYLCKVLYAFVQCAEIIRTDIYADDRINHKKHSKAILIKDSLF